MTKPHKIATLYLLQAISTIYMSLSLPFINMIYITEASVIRPNLGENRFILEVGVLLPQYSDSWIYRFYFHTGV